jgi:branched-chain amino acid transport system permease protein
VILIGALAAAALWAFVYKTRFGVMLRATSQDKRMAAALGVNVKRIYVQAFAIGCFMAGLGGAVVMPISGAVLGMGVDALILASSSSSSEGSGPSRARWPARSSSA